jgi:hypothetical protein
MDAEQMDHANLRAEFIMTYRALLTHRVLAKFDYALNWVTACQK